MLYTVPMMYTYVHTTYTYIHKTCNWYENPLFREFVRVCVYIDIYIYMYIHIYVYTRIILIYFLFFFFFYIYCYENSKKKGKKEEAIQLIYIERQTLYNKVREEKVHFLTTPYYIFF